MSIPFLRGHAAPLCALKGTCGCLAPLHEGGGGSLGIFIALCSRPSACMPPPPLVCVWGGGGCLRFHCRCVPPPGVLWLLLCAPCLHTCVGRAMCAWVSWVPRGTTVPHFSVGDGTCRACGVAVLVTELQFLHAGSRFRPPSGALSLQLEI